MGDVGVFVGTPVGKYVGSLEGQPVGDVGVFVGTPVGKYVGSPDGVNDGSPEGQPVGGVGVFVGRPLGKGAALLLSSRATDRGRVGFMAAWGSGALDSVAVVTCVRAEMRTTAAASWRRPGILGVSSSRKLGGQGFSRSHAAV